MNKAIQFIGTQRSGSNLLRLILNQFEQVSAPHPPHILRTFIPLINYYGNLDDRDNFEPLVADVCEYVNNNIVSWSNVVYTPDIVLKRCTKNNIFEIFKVIYEIKAEFDHASIWCCKSTFNANYITDLEKHDIKPIYIHLYRDGRDVAASFRKAIIGPKHIYHIANEWKNDQQAARKVLNIVGEARVVSVKYEELIKEPELVLSEISKKLGLKYNPKILSFYNSEESFNTASAGKMWENLTKPIIHNHFGMYRKELSDEDILLFDRIAGDELYSLGYNNTWTDRSNGTPLFTQDQILEFNRSNDEMKLKARNNASAEELERRKKQEAVLRNIKELFKTT